MPTMFDRLREFLTKPPEQEVREPPPPPTDPLTAVVTMGALAYVLSDSRTTLADQAVFVAAPFILSAAARAGAEAGAREAEEAE
jgi:hypothetical protein